MATNLNKITISANYKRALWLLITLASCMLVCLVFYGPDLYARVFSLPISPFEYPLDIKNLKSLVQKLKSDVSQELCPSMIGNMSHLTSCEKPIGYKEIIRNLPQIFVKGNLIMPYDHTGDIHYIYQPNTTCLKYWSSILYNSDPYLSQNESSEETQKIKSEKITVVVVIMSAVNYYKRRQTVRDTWYPNGDQQTQGPFSFKPFFSVGACDLRNPVPEDLKLSNGNKWSAEDCEQAIKNESEEFGDILQLSAVDTYYNMTYKTLMNMKYVNEMCLSDFVLFIDDDYLVNFEYFAKFMEFFSTSHSIESYSYSTRLKAPFTRSVEQNRNISKSSQMKGPIEDESGKMLKRLMTLSDQDLYLGHGYMASYPQRSKFDKWAISLSDYPYEVYPPFINGGFIVISRATLADLYYGSYFNKFFIFNDVYLGIVAKKLEIRAHIYKEFFCPIHILEYEETVFNNTCVAWHDIEIDKLKSIWRFKTRVY